MTTGTVPGRADAAREPGGLPASLEPVRRALLADARDEAAQRSHAADEAAEARVVAAQDQADQAVEEARRRARATARARADRAVDAARREAHAVLLEAESRIWDEFVERLHAAVRSFPSDPRYPALLDRLEELARDQLGADATVHRDPGGGGVVATSGGRRVDYRLTALADRALDPIADRMAEVWR